MAVLLPQEIQNDFDLFAQNERLKQLRADFNEAVSKMETGSYSVKQAFAGLVDQINSLLDTLTSAVETTVIPKDSFQDFLDGVVTLDEFGSFDIIEYYNGLKKLRFMYYGATVALQQLQDVPVKPVSPAITAQTGVLDSLDSNEFIEQGSDNPVFEAQQSFKYYVIVAGDTLQTIASKVFDGDINRWPEIAQANSISDSDLLDNNLVGQTLKIPTEAAASNNLQSNNLVFELYFLGTTQKEIDRFNYGRDLDLFEKKLQISGTGDLKRNEGLTCLVDNLQARFDNSKGALNPLNPTWGLDSPGDASDIPFVIILDRLLSNMESQATDDPRVVSAAVLRKQIEVDGDVIRVPMDITLIGNRDLDTTFDIRNIL